MFRKIGVTYALVSKGERESILTFGYCVVKNAPWFITHRYMEDLTVAIQNSLGLKAKPVILSTRRLWW